MADIDEIFVYQYKYFLSLIAASTIVKTGKVEKNTSENENSSGR